MVSPTGGPGRLPILVLTGPTGTGKSDLAARLAELEPVEIVSVDSALVYRGLDIGTAKPDASLRARIPHHLVDIRDAGERYSAGDFLRDAMGLVRDIQARGRIPLLTGGTMLYLRALRRGLAELPPAAPAVRAAIDAEAALRGWPALHAELARIDPAAAARIGTGDRQRIQRALEIWRITGRTASALQLPTPSPLADYTVHAWTLLPGDRASLHAALAQRLEAMMGAGFLEEVRGLRARGDLDPRCPAMRAVGYRQLWAHLEGEYDLAEAVRRALEATRQLAKRQLTWLRAEPWGEALVAGQSGPAWLGTARRALAAARPR